jgi:hypothetical protein
MRFDTPLTQQLGRTGIAARHQSVRRPVFSYQGSSSANSLLTAHQIGAQINRPPKALMFFKWRAAHVGQTTYQFLWLDHQCRRDRFFCGTTRLFRQPKSRSDCRLQTAELRPGELQFPPVRIQARPRPAAPPRSSRRTFSPHGESISRFFFLSVGCACTQLR